MSDDNLSPELEQTLDDHIAWVNQATELALSEEGDGRRSRPRYPHTADWHTARAP